MPFLTKGKRWGKGLLDFRSESGLEHTGQATQKQWETRVCLADRPQPEPLLFIILNSN